MGSPRDGNAGYQRVVWCGRNNVELGFCRLAVFAVREYTSFVAIKREQREATGPMLLLWTSGDDCEVGLSDPVVGEQAAHLGDGPLAARHEQYATGVFIQPMNVPHKTNSPTPCPMFAVDHRTHQQGMQVVRDAMGVFRSQLPARRLVDGQQGTVFVQDGDPQTGETDVGRERHKVRASARSCRQASRPGEWCCLPAADAPELFRLTASPGQCWA